MEWVLVAFAILVLVAWIVTRTGNAFSRVESPFGRSDVEMHEEALAGAKEQNHRATTTCHVCSNSGSTMVILQTQEYYVVCDNPVCESAPQIAAVRHLELDRIPLSR